MGAIWVRDRASLTPLGVFIDKFDERPGRSGGNFGGEARGDSFFRGDAAIFADFRIDSRALPLTLIAEYESDQYDREVRFGSIDSPSAWNLGCMGGRGKVSISAPLGCEAIRWVLPFPRR